MRIILIKFRSAFIVILLVSVMGQALPVLAKQSAKQVDVYFVPMQFMFNETQLAPPSDQLGFIYKNSTYVPMRFISYALDKTVDWDPATYTVSVSQPNEEDRTSIDAYKRDREVAKAEIKPMDSSKLVSSGIKVYEERVSYVFDGEAKQPKEGLSGLIYKDRLYVPMRFFSEAVGQKIEWDPKTYTVKAQTISLTVPETVDLKPTATVEPTSAPTPAPTTSDVQTGGATGGVTEKPTEAQLRSAAEMQMFALGMEASNAFSALKSQYDSADSATKETLKLQGNSMLSGYNSRFAVILNDLRSQLVANGYGTSSIALYQQFYDSQVQSAMGGL